MLEVLSLAAAGLTILYLPFWIVAIRKGVFSWRDCAFAFAPPALWIALTHLNIGAQSLRNMSELIVLALTTWACYVLILTLSQRPAHRRRISLALGLLLAFAVGLRLFTPLLPE